MYYLFNLTKNAENKIQDSVLHIYGLSSLPTKKIELAQKDQIMGISRIQAMPVRMAKLIFTLKKSINLKPP